MRIQILVTDNIGRYEAGRRRPVESAVAFAGPAVKPVRHRARDHLVVTQAGAVEAVGLLGIDGVGSAFPVDLCPARTHNDVGGILARIDHDPVVAALAHGEGQIGRVDLEHLVGPEATHPQVHGALRHLQLHDPIVEVEYGQAGAAAHADAGTTDLDFRPRCGIGPQAVAIGQRPIDRRPYPVGFTRRRETDCAARVTQPGDPRWWISADPAAEGQQQQTGGKGKGANSVCVHLHGVASMWQNVSKRIATNDAGGTTLAIGLQRGRPASGRPPLRSVAKKRAWQHGPARHRPALH